MLQHVIERWFPARTTIPIHPEPLNAAAPQPAPTFPCFMLEVGSEVNVYLALDGHEERAEYSGLVHRLETVVPNVSWLVTVWGNQGQQKFLSSFDGGRRIFEVVSIGKAQSNWICAECGREKNPQLAKLAARPHMKGGVWVWVVERYLCLHHQV